MSSKAYSLGTSAECPHCGTILGSIDSYAVYGYTGESSRKESICPACYKTFYVEHVGKGQYWVDSEPYEDYDDEDDFGGKKW